MPYIVETFTMLDGWVNCWHDGDDLATFATQAEALKALEDFKGDYYEDSEEEFPLEDYRIRKVEDETG
jgi:hypothetical protein